MAIILYSSLIGRTDLIGKRVKNYDGRIFEIVAIGPRYGEFEEVGNEEHWPCDYTRSDLYVELEEEPPNNMQLKTIRDEFAMAALQGILAGRVTMSDDTERSVSNDVKAAYFYADKALAEREKSNKK